MTNCWICGDIADSKEHKFKASDLKRFYGKKFDCYYIQESAVQIESYKDRVLKFPEVICTECNVTRTRKHDDAYDIFINYCHNNYDFLLETKELNFENIYGINWVEEKRNLYRYFAKHAGCKIVTSEYPQDLTDLSEFILGKETTENLALRFELKMIIKLLHSFYNKDRKFEHLFNAQTLYYGYYDNLSLAGWLSNNWITTNWVFSKNINPVKKSDFAKKTEILKVVDLNYYDRGLLETETYDEMIKHFEFGELNTLEKRIEHYKEIIE
jgi:hypothetical protein